MSRLVTWYLVELDGLLRGRVSSDRLHTLLSEVELHLAEALEERRARGMAEDEAELAVIEAMGSPERIAEKELGESKWVDLGRKIGIGSALAMGGLWFVLGFTPESVFHSNVGLALVLGLPLFWLGCLLSRSLLWRPLIVAGALGAMSLAIHQGTRHVYLNDQEIRVEAAAFAVEKFPTLVGEDTIVAQGETLAWNQERQAAALVELAKSPVARTVERLPQAVIALTLVTGLFALVGFALANWPRPRMRSWLRRRLA